MLLGGGGGGGGEGEVGKMVMSTNAMYYQSIL